MEIHAYIAKFIVRMTISCDIITLWGLIDGTAFDPRFHRGFHGFVRDAGACLPGVFHRREAGRPTRQKNRFYALKPAEFQAML